MKYDDDWYNSLAKPNFQPPAWVFAPVWTVLYVLMAVSLIVIAITPFRIINVFGYLLFLSQIVVNLSWAPAFFKEHNLRKAFLICVLLTALVFLTMIVFFNISMFAGILFVPYFFWCCFATVLSFEILELNEW